ncbi:MAG: hypothetical protein P8K68_03835 [Algibacter sp.]|uniref:hypothetical protein n=1 Tax=Algibacter sp. TaxID=1872428 RepID=UPI00260963EC|nr:hypothetical protein [Algibacter sp.]MDG1729750.1 hypothetical protein [Algibacter sp.]MDG2177904.1 hypothetical protein [Algibacter sp.]
MNRLNQFIERHISGKKVLSLFIITNVIYVFMLTITIPRTMAFSDGMKLLDMMPMGYDLNYVSELFNALGEIGRDTYLTKQIPVDMFYPLLFGLSYCLLLGYFLKKLNKLKTPYSFLCLLPIIAGIADYFENFGIVAMLSTFPDVTNILVSATNVFTIIKSVSTTLFFITLIIVLVTLGFSTIKRKNK